MAQKQVQKEKKDEEVIKDPFRRLNKIEKEIEEIKKQWLLKEIEEADKQIEKGEYEVVVDPEKD